MAEQTNSISFNEVYKMALEDYPINNGMIDEAGNLVDLNETQRLAWMRGFIKAKTIYRNGKD